MEEKLNDQEQVRFDKLAKYRELGVDPFGKKYEWSDQIRDLRKLYGDLTAEELAEKNIHCNVAGRLLAIRRMGKASFVNIKDEYGSIQAWIGINVIGEHDYDVFKLADLGDRYLDMIVNDDSRKIALTRPAILKEIRRYCDDLGFVEVETPVLSPIAGGASARPFITHHNALDKDFYLRIATELNLKKAMIGGIDRVYEIGRIFRNEGIDTRHNPEFTTIELYQAYGDLQDMRHWVEGLFKSIAEKVIGQDVVSWGERTIDFSKPFGWVSMTDAIKEKTGIDFTKEMTFEEAVALAKEHHVELEKSWNSVGYIIQAFFDEFVEKDLIQPTFVHTYPIEVSPLTKKSDDPRFVERFELFIGGFEFGNAYTELNDPFDQKERFEAQLAARNRGDEEANDIDFSFLDAMRYGMPPAGGIGVGIDRLCMLFTNTMNIREVLLFPTMKDEK